MTLYQIIFTNIDGDMVVIQGTNQADVFLDAYARYLELPVNEDAMSEWGIRKWSLTKFHNILISGGYLEIPFEPKIGGCYINTFIHYNT